MHLCGSEAHMQACWRDSKSASGAMYRRADVPSAKISVRRSCNWGSVRGGSSRGCPPPPRSDLTWTRQRVTLYPLPARSDLTWASDPLRAALADLKLGGGYPLPQPRSDLTWARQRVRRAEGRRRTGSTVAPDPHLASRVYVEVAEHFPGAIRSVERVVMPAAVLRSSCAGE